MALPEILREILAKRGVVTDEEVDKFLNPALGDLAKPEDLPGVTAAARSILSAVKRGRTIIVFGDYDCDGICATAIMVKTLLALKARVAPFIPKRLDEGYGMSEAAVRRMIRENPRVGMVITVDNGINSVERVNELRRRDIEVIVTDHHLPGDTLPNCPVVDPMVLAPPHLKLICGAAVAYFIAYALIQQAKEARLYCGEKIAGELLVMAGLATVTDIMPLIGQNRIIVNEALRLFHRHAPIGLRRLYESTARRPQELLTTKDFGFLLGPRINAAARISTGIESLQLLLVRREEEVRAALLQVDACNVKRKEYEQAMVTEAMSRLDDQRESIHREPALVIDLTGGHQGVSGVVAARILEHLGDRKVPVCVIFDRRGSARAPIGYNVRDAFIAAAETLDDFGGHKAAGGFTVKPGRIDDFRRLFGANCALQRQSDTFTGVTQRSFGPKFDAEITTDTLTLDFAEWVGRLEPFGEGNEEPVFRISNVTLTDVKPVGSDGRHLGLTVRKGNVRLRSVWWGAGDKVEEYRAGSGIAFDAYFHVEISTYQERHVELRLIQLDPVR